YSFDLDGVRVLHTGDIGRPFLPEHLEALRGKVDVMLAIAGAVHNIAHDAMLRAIEQIGPRIVIPMHYHNPKGILQIKPVSEFARHFPADRVVRVGGAEVVLTPETLPAERHLYILEESR
ncbi:MAG: MBL fold metallo-hydrolase, partial [Acidobacteriota bacterium]|nr:MBL fold metallo-hydrolase [Acidobacteriota bacterium]